MIALGAFFGAWESTEQVVEWMAERVRIDDVILAAQNAGGLWGNLFLLIAMVLAALLLLPLISVLGALFKYYGYQLWADDDTYRKIGGLLTRHEESLKRHKIQAIVLKQNFVARLFKRSNMLLRVASAGSGIDSGQLPSGARSTFLIPALHPLESQQFCSEFFPGCDLESVRFTRIERRRLTIVALAIVAFPALAVSTPLSFLFGWKFLAIMPIALGIAWAATRRFWQKSGYAIVGDHGFVRRGFFGTTVTVFPLFKVQRIDISQTPGQRRRGLAHLSIHLASHSLNVPYMRIEDTEKLRDIALLHVETSRQAWY